MMAGAAAVERRSAHDFLVRKRAIDTYRHTPRRTNEYPNYFVESRSPAFTC